MVAAHLAEAARGADPEAATVSLMLAHAMMASLASGSKRDARTPEERDAFHVASSKFKHLGTDRNLAVDIGRY